MRELSTLVDLLRFRADHQPNARAFVFLRDGETEDDDLTYGELDRRARAIAAHLQAMGAASERALLLYSPNLDFVTAFFGCLYARVLAVPAYPPRPNQTLTRLRAMMDDAGATLALTTESQLANMARLLEQNSDFASLRWVTTDTLPEQLERDWQDPNTTSDTLAFLQYTSGSTGIPKGVMVSHGNLMHNSRLIQDSFEDTPQSIGMSWLPPYHDMGLIGGVLQPIYSNLLLVMMSPVSFLQRPFRWLQAISRYRVTTSGGPNFAYDLCIRQVTEEQRQQLDLSSWTLAFSGAEPVRAETLERFVETFAPCGFRPEAFYPCYGMAEATLFATGGDRTTLPTIATVQGSALEKNQVIAAAAGEPDVRKLVGCGRCHPDQRLAIVDPDTMRLCADDEVGEIWLSGESVAQGYWKRPQQSQETFEARIVGADRDLGDRPFLRTGDLGFLHRGELFVTGRIKDLIIIRGLNHYPQDIELTVDQCHPALRQGCNAAFSVEIDGDERLVIAQEVERRALRRLKVEDVTRSMRQAVAEHHQLQPYGVLLLKTGSIPKTSSGKIQRHACKDGFLNDTLDIVGQWIAAEPTAARSESIAAPAHPAEHVSPLSSADAVRRSPTLSPQVQGIRQWLAEKLAQNIGVRPADIDVREPFARYGLDSVTAIRLSAELEDWLGRSLSPTLVYDYPTIEALAEYLGNRSSEEQTVAQNQASGDSAIDLAQPAESDEAIAIVGLGCRFPGAESPDEFWQLLREGRDAIRSVDDRWKGDSSTHLGGFLRQVDQFDPQFFGISPREAVRMDPQQRLLLEVSWEALEQAGIAPSELAGSATGVFVGISNYDYSQLQMRAGSRGETAHDPYAGTGNAHSIVANRLSYFLDLRGPSLTVDTACSSSLVAVHVACQHLRHGDCTQAIVGGVNLILSPDLTTTFTQAGMMAPDGRCKTFDASADGYVRGEGCGVVVLKRLSAAQRDGDRILAVIQGSAVNQDGRSNGLTAPNGPAQQAVVLQALKRAGVAPDQISYVDAHGTGTPLGDPIELNSLKAVLMQGRSPEQPCWVGSAKTNIGHLESAAGIAGLIKVVLALQHQEIPPHLHLQTLNPHISLEGTPIQIPTQSQPWPTTSEPRLAGVSSFGFGGTNAHVILAEAAAVLEETVQPSSPVEQAEAPADATLSQSLERPRHLIGLSAKGEQALRDLAQRYINFLDQHPQLNLADIAFTANTGRSPLTHRLTIATANIDELRSHLSAFLQESPFSSRAVTDWSIGPTQGTPRPKVAFLFTGQGAQYVHMGYELYQTQPTVRRILDECDRLLRPYLDTPLLQVLYGQTAVRPFPYPHPTDASRTLPPNTLGDASRTSPPSLLDQTAYTQPALFALEYALAQLWMSWGIQPDVVMGHSVGEYVAACLAGVFSLEDGLKLIAARSRLMQNLPTGGAMAAVFAPESLVRTTLASHTGTVDIAAVNGARNVVISGQQEAVDAVVAELEADGIEVRSLQVSHAFHSTLMEPMLDEFRHVAQSITYAPPQRSLVSNLTGQWAGEEVAQPDYWCRHVRHPVLFAAGIETLYRDGYTVFLELGPKATLCSMGRRHLADTQPENSLELEWLPSLRPGRTDWTQLLRSLGRLYTLGVTIDWRGFDQDYRRQRLTDLPTYPWQRQRYWFTSGWEVDESPLSTPDTTPDADVDWNTWLYETQWVSLPEPMPVVAESSRAVESGTWILLCDTQGVGQRLTEQLQALKQTVVQVKIGDEFAEAAPSMSRWTVNPARPEDFEQLLKGAIAQSPAPLKGIIHLWSIDRPTPSDSSPDALQAAQVRGCASALHSVQALLRHGGVPAPKLWMVTQQATEQEGDRPASADAPLSIAAAPLWGFSKVLAWEHPELWGGIVDIDIIDVDRNGASDAFESGAVAPPPSTLATCLLNPDTERWLRLRDGQRYGLRIVPYSGLGDAPPSDTNAHENAMGADPAVDLKQPDSTYLITGGLGALGLSVAQWLVDQGAPHVTLVSRRSPSEAVQARLEALRAAGAEVLVISADITQAPETTRIVDTIQAAGRSLRGVIHAAGVLQDGLLAQQTWEQFQTVLAPKVAGAWNLHRATEGMPLAFFVLFSSVASLLGSPGQGNYAAANGFLDALAHWRQAQGLPALSLNWGPWAAAGMAEELTERDRTRLTLNGIDHIPVETGLEILEQFLLSDSVDQTPAQVGVVPVRWADLLARIPAELCPAYLADVAQTVDAPAPAADEIIASPATPAIFERLKQADVNDRTPLLIDYLRHRIAAVLQLDPQQIAASDSLVDRGMDSLMVMEAMNQVRQDLQLMLYPREFYERPRLEALADYLASEFERIHLQVGAPPQADAHAGMSDSVTPSSLSLLGRGDRLSISPTLMEAPAQKLPGIVFILSSPRAGSTLLRVMLAGHPDVFAAPELHLLPFNTLAEREASLTDAHLSEGLQRTVMELKGLDAAASQQMLQKWIATDLSIDQVYAQLQTWAGDRQLVDKSPTYGMDRAVLDRAEALFADAKYIHLVRHPYAVVESFVRMRMDKLLGQNSTDPYILAEQVWTQCNQNIHDFLATVDDDRQFQLQYEDLVRQPETVLSRLCEFLDVPFEAQMANPYEGDRMTDGVHTTSLSVGDPNFLQHTQLRPELAEVWRSIELPRPLSAPTRAIATDLGYELPRETPHFLKSGVQASQPPASPIPMEEQQVTVRGLPLCLCTWGESTQPPILCLHGILEQGAVWDPIAQALVQQGFYVIAPDLRGHGRSSHVGSGGSYHLLDFLSDVDTLTQSFTASDPTSDPNSSKLTLVGHSMGSIIAAMLASLRPQRIQSLVLVETILPTDDRHSDPTVQLTTHLDYLASPPQHTVFPDVDAAAARLQQATPSLSEARSLALAERIVEPCEGGVRWRWDPMLKTRAGITFNNLPFSKAKYLELVRGIQNPVTLVYGDQSTFNREDDLAEQQSAFPTAQRVGLPGGHNVHLDAPQALTDIIAGAVAPHTPRSLAEQKRIQRIVSKGD